MAFNNVWAVEPEDLFLLDSSYANGDLSRKQNRNAWKLYTQERGGLYKSEAIVTHAFPYYPVKLYSLLLNPKEG